MSSSIPVVSDSDRRSTATLSASTGPVTVGFPVFGGADDLSVFVNGVLINAADWTLTSFSGLNVASDTLPAGDGRVTFDNAQTGDVEVIGEVKPKRLSQFTPGVGIGAESFNLTFSVVIATLRELYAWGKASLKLAPGDRAAPLPTAVERADMVLSFNASGDPEAVVSKAAIVDAVDNAEAAATAAAASALSAASNASAAQTAETNAETAETNAEAAQAAAEAAAQQAALITALKRTFDPSTSMADPGTGEFRLNHATPASATAIAINVLSPNTGNPNEANYLKGVDDSTTTTWRATITIRKIGAPENYARYKLTSTFTDNTTWLQGTISYLDGNGTLTGDFSIEFSMTGNQGAGDMLGANNGSDFASPKAAYDNLSVKGADVASASTIDLDTATGSLVDVTGTTTITAITLSNGRRRIVRFTGALTLTHGASLVLPGGANITTAAGDFAIFAGYASSVVRCVAYVKANGKVIVPNDISEITGTALAARGYTATSYSAGTKSTGTFTPDPTLGNFQHATNGGAHTLAPPSSVCTMLIEYVNNGSAGTVTTSGFTKVTGDTITTTNGHKFAFFITKTQNYSHLHVQALQ